MKILIANKFFYPRGGDCVVAMATRELLMRHGHEVRVFAMRYGQNIDLPDAATYAPEVRFGEGLRGDIGGMKRIFGKGDIVKSAEAVLDEFRPDVVHLHNVHSYLSPVIGEIAHRRGIRVVWTLHDYKLICPAYSCRTVAGGNCERCVSGPLAVAANRCMKGSLARSLMADAEARWWNRRRLDAMTDIFIAPSSFLRNKMIEGGFPHRKIVTLNNFIDPAKLRRMEESTPGHPEGYFCYIGRLSEEKGVETMLRAAADSGVELRVAGGGPLADTLRRKYADTPRIRFLGHLGSEAIVDLLKGAEASVLPSEWYENNPLGVIESLCAGTPVIGARIGGIPELIDSTNGVTYASTNGDELGVIFSSFGKRHAFDREAIAAAARSRFSDSSHYDSLMRIYSPGR